MPQKKSEKYSRESRSSNSRQTMAKANLDRSSYRSRESLEDKARSRHSSGQSHRKNDTSRGSRSAREEKESRRHESYRTKDKKDEKREERSTKRQEFPVQEKKQPSIRKGKETKKALHDNTLPGTKSEPKRTEDDKSREKQANLVPSEPFAQLVESAISTPVITTKSPVATITSSSADALSSYSAPKFIARKTPENRFTTFYPQQATRVIFRPAFGPRRPFFAFRPSCFMPPRFPCAIPSNLRLRFRGAHPGYGPLPFSRGLPKTVQQNFDIPPKIRGRHPGYGPVPFVSGPFPDWALGMQQDVLANEETVEVKLDEAEDAQGSKDIQQCGWDDEIPGVSDDQNEPEPVTGKDIALP